jgi:GNAT superfamily N-acetyltransferase
MMASNPPGILIRLATPADSVRIAELSGQLGYPATREQTERRLHRILGDPRHAVLVAEIAEGPGSSGHPSEVIGWVHVQERPVVQGDLRAELTALVVAESHRRLGAGRMLMQRAEEWAREHGCTAVMLRSNIVREGAHEFYEAIGYRTLKMQKTFLKEFLRARE